MINVIQRVDSASVSIDGTVHNKIGSGLLILAGICLGDNESAVRTAAKKIIDLRIFSDENGKMNLSLKDTAGEALVISQFTLCNDRSKSGNRPSFTLAEKPETAIPLYELFLNELGQQYLPEKIKSGVFAAKMKIELINDGPVTIIMDK